MIDLPKTESLFEWKDPIDGDKWNKSYGEETVKIGVVGEQILVRVYGSLKKGSTWQKEFNARIIKNESSTGASWGAMLGRRSRLEDIQRYVEDYLFGAIRDFILCSVCGHIKDVSGYYDDIKNKLLEKNMCHTCDHWESHIKKLDDELVCVVNGYWYKIDTRESMPNSCKGHAGNRFNIRWKDGRTRTTTNLWNAGEIPKRYGIEDTAEFITDKEME